MYGYSDFGKQTKIAMVSMNLTSRQLAQMLDYKESTLCDLLKGRNRNIQRQNEIKELLINMQQSGFDYQKREIAWDQADRGGSNE